MSILKKRISKGLDKSGGKLINPTDIFKHLTPKTGYNYLRDVQKEFLLSWHDHRSSRDIVGKLNTGAGKTLIALLMLKSKINEGVGPAVYLCPDRQLVDQVVKQANLFNIPVVTIPNYSDQAAEFPLEFIRSEAILVCTFERLFNGKSIFGVDGYGYREIQPIGSLVVDDAHSCIKKARSQCTITIEKSHNIYPAIFNLFKDSLKHQNPGALAAIIAEEPSVSCIVPYWSWQRQKDNVMEILTVMLKHNDSSVIYNWGLIGDELSQCECYISADKIEITPLKLPIHKIPSFNKSSHRYILSATFDNDTDLYKELGIEMDAISNPIEIENKGDSGERLIITPKRYHLDLNDSLMREFVSSYSKEYNVVVLVQNRTKAKIWKEKFNATVVTKENILTATEKLRTTQGNLMVFVNRYDGLDLEGDSCRLLVIDGKPSAYSLKDRYLQKVREGSPILNAQIAQTIEQGLGRAVRSGTDHCVVFLLDNSLVNFIATKQQHFAQTTRKQIDFGLKLFEGSKPESIEEALIEIKEAIKLVLTGDQEWREFHKDMILSIEEEEPTDKTKLLKLAENELISIDMFREGKEEEACNNLLDYINTHKDDLENIDEAWYFQLAASLIYPTNPIRANDLQLKAKEKSSNVLKPVNNYKSKLVTSKGKQSQIIKRWLENFTNGVDVHIAIENLTTNLIYSQDLDSDQFEEAVKQIGEFLGFSSTRPEAEEGDGPDNLWRLENNINVIIEAKSRRTGDQISRGDIEQLLHSIQWHKNIYGDNQEYIPILMHKSRISMNDAHPSEDMRCIPRENLETLKECILKLGTLLSRKSPASWTEHEIQQLLHQTELKFDRFVSKFSTKIR